MTIKIRPYLSKSFSKISISSSFNCIDKDDCSPIEQTWFCNNQDCLFSSIKKNTDQQGFFSLHSYKCYLLVGLLTNRKISFSTPLYIFSSSKKSFATINFNKKLRRRFNCSTFFSNTLSLFILTIYKLSDKNTLVT